MYELINNTISISFEELDKFYTLEKERSFLVYIKKP